MGATATDLVAGTRAAKIVERSDSAILTAWPDARDGKASPSTGYFDSAADALAALTLAAALIGVARRRFSADVQSLIFIDPANGVPSWRLVDGEAGVDAVCLVARVEVDLESERTRVEVMG